MKNQKGITLVALVITIIVLLILAGVSISLVVGQNGVLGKATNAVSANEEATVLQDAKLGVADAQMAYYSAWVTNQSVAKYTFYSTESYYKNNCSSGSVSITTAATSDNGSVVLTYTTSSKATYEVTVSISDGTVTAVKK